MEKYSTLIEEKRFPMIKKTDEQRLALQHKIIDMISDFGDGGLEFETRDIEGLLIWIADLNKALQSHSSDTELVAEMNRRMKFLKSKNTKKDRDSYAQYTRGIYDGSIDELRHLLQFTQKKGS